MARTKGNVNVEIEVDFEKEKKYTKRAILLNLKGVKKDILKALLKDGIEYSLTEVEDIYKKFLEGGKN